jgi:hypothetical protein
MSTEILLQYKRDGEKYDGIFFENNEIHTPFKSLTFASMMTTLHHLLSRTPDATVKLQRAENDSFLPIFMEQNMVDLLRTDPAKYIQAHTIPHRTIDMRKSDRTGKLAEKYVVPTPSIRAGHATLAASFGDVVYLNYRNNRVESPLTGRWCFLAELVESGLSIVEYIQQDGYGWVTVSIEQLLDLGSNSHGYYLPREWNESAPWISKAALASKYNQYKEERDKCLETTHQKTP